NALDTTACEECVRDRRKAADRVGAGLRDIADDEHLNRSELAERDARTNTDQLLGDALIDEVPRVGEREAAHVDRADLGEADEAVPTDRQEIFRVAVAEQLNVQRVAGPDHVIRRNGNVARRKEAFVALLEDIVAVRLERLDSDRIE